MLRLILIFTFLAGGCAAPRQQTLRVDVYARNVDVLAAKLSGNGEVAVSYSSVW
jgi:hypothetical protein